MKMVFVIQVMCSVVVFNTCLTQAEDMDSGVSISLEHFTALSRRVNAMEQKQASTEADINQLNTYVGSVGALMTRHFKVENALDEMQNELPNVRRDHDNDITDLRGEIQDTKQNLEIAIHELRERNHDNDITELRNKMQEMQQNHENIMLELNRQNTELRNGMQPNKENHERVVLELRRELQEIKQDRDSFRNQIQIITKDRDELQNETLLLKQDVEEILLKIREDQNCSKFHQLDVDSTKQELMQAIYKCVENVTDFQIKERRMEATTSAPTSTTNATTSAATESTASTTTSATTVPTTTASLESRMEATTSVLRSITKASTSATTESTASTASSATIVRTATTSLDGLSALQRQCPDGTFGYKCMFRCRCARNRICDKETGECPNGCDDGYWGPGCQLANSCFYDGKSRNYMGTKSVTKQRHICQRWDSQEPHRHSYNVREFPDETMPENYCRTTTDSARPWCYTTSKELRWQHCDTKNCNCPPGRFGNNCLKECHCADLGESCDSILGTCSTGCAQGWDGYDCQTAVSCPANRYSWDCSKACYCTNPLHCNRFTGPTKDC